MTRPPVRYRIITASLLTVAALYFLVPVYWLAVSATKNSADLFGTFGFWFSDHPRPVAYLVEVLTYDHGIYARWFANSLFYAGVGAVCATLLSAAAKLCAGEVPVPRPGGALQRGARRGADPRYGAGAAALLPLQRDGTVQHLLGGAGPQCGQPVRGLSVPDLRGRRGPRLAAGGGPDRWRGGGPDLRRARAAADAPALVTVFLFQFVHIWNNYFLPLVMLSDSGLYPIQLGLTSWTGYADRQPVLYQYTVGGAFLSVVPLMVLMTVLQRYWRTGLTEGSVKA